MRSKLISPSLQRIVRYRTFVQEKLMMHRKSMSSVVVKLGWVDKIIRVVRFSEVHPEFLATQLNYGN